MDTRRPLAGWRATSLVVAAIVLLVAGMAIFSPRHATSAAPTKSIKLGLFWNDPKDGTSVQTIASTAHLVAVSQGREWYRDDLRAAGYTGGVLQYMHAEAVDGPGPYLSSSATCNSNYDPLSNQVADKVGDFCRYIHPNE